jgi:structural maintenance of chromosome 4
MKPKAKNEHEDGLLEYLEDIIGTSGTKPEIDALAVRVEALNEERTSKLQRVQAVEREKNRLEGKKNEAVLFIKLENRLAFTENAFLQGKMWEDARDVGDIEEEIVRLLLNNNRQIALCRSTRKSRKQLR